MMRQSVKDLASFVLRLALEPPVRATDRSRAVKVLLWALAGVGAVAAAARLIRGLGATTNLSDVTPWGLWVGFDVLSQIAMAAAGFVIAALVYILHLEKFRKVLRVTILAAFLGYSSEIIVLLFDLGIPWNIWRPVVFWQYHSALFEVAWCIMLYFTVLALELSPVVFEKMPFPRLFKFFKSLALPLALLGIALSTLHQSSLGTLFLIMPFRLDPLWNSQLQPLLFFVSAIGLGLCMIILVYLSGAWLYHRPDESPLLSGLARAAAAVLALYLAVRLTELGLRGQFHHLVQPTWETGVFGVEVLLSAVIPIVLFALPGVRSRRGGLLAGSLSAVTGFVLNRINVSGISTVSVTGADYFPAWTEFAISAGVASAAALVFLFFVEHFSVYDEVEKGGDEAGVRRAGSFVPGLGGHWAGDGAFYSLVFVVAASAAFALLPDDAVHGPRPRPTPVQSVRTIDAVSTQGEGEAFPRLALAGSAAGSTADLPALLLDGDRNGRFVIFNHRSHQEMQGQDGCGYCHHLNRPLDKATPCSVCHRDMFLPTDIFSHPLHRDKLGGNHGCRQCHPAGTTKSRATAAPCLSCHRKMVADGSSVTLPGGMLIGKAPSYQQAMHGLCRSCHRGMSEEFGRCGVCHRENDRDHLRRQSGYPAPQK